MQSLTTSAVTGLGLAMGLMGCVGVQDPEPAPEDTVLVFNRNGGWCWFEDERAVVHRGHLVIGSVSSAPQGHPDRGDVDLTVYDIATGRLTEVELHDGLESDDHDSPALLPRPDGSLLAVYSKHGPENRFYYRVSALDDFTSWGPEQTFVPSEPSRITYSNLHRLADENQGRGRVYNFFRGLHASFKPSYVYSDDDGATWTAGHVLIDVPSEFKHRPYVKYASDGRGTVHLFYTEGHPRNFDNSTYHVFLRGGMLHGSDGTSIAPITEGLARPEQGTRVFQGDADHVAWVSDLHLDAAGRPYGASSVQVGSAGLPPRQGGDDHRYRYDRFDGRRWVGHQIAYAGTRLYAGEDDYTGNISLHPHDPDVVFFSSDVDPATGERLPGGHYEIFRANTADDGATWSYTAITRDSTVDNLRPIVPPWEPGRTVLLWLRGTYRSYTDYDLEVVGVIWP